MDRFEKEIAAWISDGESIIARHEFKRLGAMIVVTQTEDVFYVYRFFTLGDRVECSVDVNAGSPATAFQRLMEVVDL